jgi:hypothetical protein
MVKKGLMSNLSHMIAKENQWRNNFFKDQEALSWRYKKYGIDVSKGAINGVVEWIKNEIEALNQGVIITCVGDPGTGKSWSSSSLLEQVDSSFNVDAISFYPREFLYGLKEGRKALLLDDVGTQLFSRDAMTRTNKQYSKLFEVIRFQNRCVALTLPTLSMLDKTLRTLTRVYIKTNSINRQSKCVNVALRFQVVDPRSDKIYRMCPVYIGMGSFNGKIHPFYRRLRTIDIPKPSEALIHAYEAKKLKAYEEFLKRMDKDKSLSSGDKTNNTPKKYAIVGKMVEEGLSIQQIANILGSNERAIKRLLRYDSNKKHLNGTKKGTTF